ncbi:hypothetical protein A9Y76_22555 [Ralstonia insidiosa]|uniref:Uncharacterized protein n=2 Tax=Ralstonia insidiosa TaxID=190721 RepID=A0A192A4L7_9RALS|nr:hypothetical protein A9Y76_22555 [Ralstonia insidiosa]
MVVRGSSKDYIQSPLTEARSPMRYAFPVKLTTQNGETKPVLQDETSYEETHALLKVLALGTQEAVDGEVKPAADVLARLRGKRSGG